MRTIEIKETATGWSRGDTGRETPTLSELLSEIRKEDEATVGIKITKIEIETISKIGHLVARVLVR